MVLLDLYRSFDGFIHRRIDSLAQRSIDRIGVNRSIAGAFITLAPLGYAMAHEHLGAGFPSSAEAAALLLPSLMLAMPEFGAAIDDLRFGPNESYDGGSVTIKHRGRYRIDRLVRSLRTVPMGIASVTAAHGLSSIVEGAFRGSVSVEGLSSLAIASAMTGPSISSYLRDRDPPAAEHDPLLAYLPTQLAPKAEHP